MLAELPASAVAEWRMFEALEPFGGDVADLRFAVLASALSGKPAAVFRHRLPSFARPAAAAAMTPEQIRAALHGGGN